MLLALDVNNYGINSFSQFFSVFVPILLFFVVWLFFYLLPSKIIADAIKKEKDKSDNIYVDKETNEYYRLSNGVKVYKKWYNTEWDFFETPYGYYIPITAWDSHIISFKYESKSK